MLSVLRWEEIIVKNYMSRLKLRSQPERSAQNISLVSLNVCHLVNGFPTVALGMLEVPLS